jgi:hypothetical protein
MGIATTTASKALRDLSDQNSQGTRLGTTSTDLICFYGATTALAQSTVVGVNALSTIASSTGAYGYGNSTTAQSIVNAIQQLKLMGLIN